MEGNPGSPLSMDTSGGPMDFNISSDVNNGASTSVAGLRPCDITPATTVGPDGKSLQCFPQRAALMKSMLNFLKKAIPDPAFSESIRHCK